MPQLLQFAQKALIPKGDKILMIKHAPHVKIVGGKYALPGGRMNFGEALDAHLEREVLEETNLIVRPLDPITISEWQITKGGGDVAESERYDLQIVAVYRLCEYISGEPSNKNSESNEGIVAVEWVNPKLILEQENCQQNELPVLQKYLQNHLHKI